MVISSIELRYVLPVNSGIHSIVIQASGELRISKGRLPSVALIGYAVWDRNLVVGVLNKYIYN